MLNVLLAPPARSMRRASFFLALLSASTATWAASTSIDELQEQNQLLRSQLDSQQKQIDALRVQLKSISDQQDARQPKADESATSSNEAGDRRLIISGEVDVAFFAGSHGSQFPHDEFRVDDADFRFEAPIAHNVFFYSELQLAKRELGNENFRLGEMYIEYENFSGALGGPDRLVNVRFGRLNIPFGEEYQQRNSLEDPLVTHSLTDFWGTDEGVELYGEFGHASYAAAVQNGGSEASHDYNADKALTLRMGYDLSSRLHVSVSAMRTGKLQSVTEPASEIWIGNGIFRDIGSGRSSIYQAQIGELDGRYHWSTGHILGAAGLARYSDNDPLADNTRHFRFYQIEAVQAITHDFYGAVRFSSLNIDRGGYPIAGIGNAGQYAYTSLRTKNLMRYTMGGGYRFNPSLLIKAEYTYEKGQLIDDTPRDNHMFSFESAVGF